MLSAVIFLAVASTKSSARFFVARVSPRCIPRPASLLAPTRAALYNPPLARNSNIKPGAALTISPTVAPQEPLDLYSCSARYNLVLISSSSVTGAPFCNFFKVSDTVTASATDLPTEANSEIKGRSDHSKSKIASTKPRCAPLRLFSAIFKRRLPASVDCNCSRDIARPNTESPATWSVPSAC